MGKRVVELALAIAIAGGLIVASAPRAGACSCSAVGADWLLAQTDVGFVGTVSSIDVIDRDDARFVFEIEAWLHGDLDDPTVEVQTSGDSASCGLEVGLGATAAVFARRDSGVITAGLCSTMRGDEALEQLGERELSGGVSSVAVPLSSPRATVGLLDEGGDVIGLAGRGSAEDALTLVSCPGGRTVVAVGADDAEIIDLSTGESEVVEVPLAPRDEIVTDVRCDQPDGAAVRLLVRGFAPESLEVRDLRGSGAPLDLPAEGDRPAQLVEGGALAVPPLGDGNAELIFVGEDGSTRDLGRVTAPTSWYDSVAIAPDGRRAVANLVDDRGAVRLAVLDLPGGEVVASIAVDAPQWPVSWTEPDRIVAAALPDANQYRYALQVLDASLRPVGVVEGWEDDDAVSAAGRVWGDGAFGLLAAPVPSAAAFSVDDLVDVTVGLPAALDEPLTVAAMTLPPLVEPREPGGASPPASSDMVTSTAPKVADGPSSGPGGDGGGAGAAPLLVVGLVIVVAIGGLVLVRRGRGAAGG